MNLKREKYYQQRGFRFVIGIDEAGRGPLAGPVTVGAVLIPLSRLKNNRKIRELRKNTRDSKKLSPAQREKVVNLIKKISFIRFAVSSVGSTTIDRINIEKATQQAAKNSLRKLKNEINFTSRKYIILIDGNRKLKSKNKIFQKTIIHGDDKVLSIALAANIAKVTRDKKMNRLASRYPQYHFEKHKGYGTKLHFKLLKKYGPCKIHRRSFIKNIVQ